MLDPQYLRAEYYDRRGTYISDAATWIDHEPSLEYRFILLDLFDKTRDHMATRASTVFLIPLPLMAPP